jgi:hypothetical protein
MSFIEVRLHTNTLEIAEVPEEVFSQLERFFTETHGPMEMDQLVKALEFAKEELPQIVLEIKESCSVLKKFKRINQNQQNLANLVQNFLYYAVYAKTEPLEYMYTPDRAYISQLCETIRILSIKRYFYIWYQARLRRFMFAKFCRTKA